MYYQNLSDGESGFTPVAGLQNISLGAETANYTYWARSNPARMGLFLRIKGGVESRMDTIAVTFPPPAGTVIWIR
jgi:hypothetical protein